MDDRAARPGGWQAIDVAERLRLLETALDLQDVAVAVTGSRGDGAADGGASRAQRILHVNRAFETMTGFAREEVVGLSPTAVLGTPDDRDADERSCGPARPEGSVRFTSRNRRKNGETYWCDVRLAPGDSGRTGFVSAARDVTAARTADGERARAEALLAGLLAGVDAAFVLADRHARPFLISAAARHVLEPTGTLGAGRTLADLVAEPDRSDVTAAVSALIGGTATEDRLSVRLADDRPVALTLHAFSGVDGSTALVATFVPATRAEAAGTGRDVPAARPESAGPAAGPERRTLTAGRLQLIELGDVRSAFGQRWEARRDQAIAAAHRIIRARLTPADTVQRTDDDGFVICFAELGETEAGYKAEAIAEEIRAWFMGEDAMAPPPSLSTVVAEVAVEPGAEDDPEALLGEIDSHLRACLETAERDAMAALRAALRTDDLRLAPTVGGGGQRTSLWRPALPAEAEDRVRRARLALPERHSVSFQAGALLLTKTVERITADLAAGRRRRYAVPLTYDAFDKRSWSDHVFSLLRGLSEPIRKSLVIEIRDVPWATGQVRLKSLSGMLGALVYAVAIELPRADAPLATDLPDEARLVTLCERHLPHGGVHREGVHGDGGRRDGGQRDADPTRKTLSRLAKRLRPARRRLLITEVSDPEAARRYLESGADLVCGPAADSLAESRSA